MPARGGPRSRANGPMSSGYTPSPLAFVIRVAANKAVPAKVRAEAEAVLERERERATKRVAAHRAKAREREAK